MTYCYYDITVQVYLLLLRNKPICKHIFVETIKDGFTNSQWDTNDTNILICFLELVKYKRIIA